MGEYVRYYWGATSTMDRAHAPLAGEGAVEEEVGDEGHAGITVRILKMAGDR